MITLSLDSGGGVTGYAQSGLSAATAIPVSEASTDSAINARMAILQFEMVRPNPIGNPRDDSPTEGNITAVPAGLNGEIDGLGAHPSWGITHIASDGASNPTKELNYRPRICRRLVTRG